MTTTPYNLIFSGQPASQQQPKPVGTFDPYNTVDAGSLAEQAQNPSGPTYQKAPDQNELVSGQLNGLLAGDSQYIQLARAQGQQNAASRGLLNSAMAGGISENAAIQSALPIAQGNAQEYSQVSAANQQAANQFTGENIAARAQTQSAGIMAGAQIHNANTMADVQRAAQAQQFQEYGMGLGYQYAGLKQSGQEFNQQLQQQMAQFTDTNNTQIGEFQQGMQWNKYALGAQMQQNQMANYSNMWMSVMNNTNLTPDQRTSFLGQVQSFNQQMSQQNAAMPAFIPDFVGDSKYWSTNWTAGG